MKPPLLLSSVLVLCCSTAAAEPTPAKNMEQESSSPVVTGSSPAKAREQEFNIAFAEYQRLSREGKWAESLPHAKQVYEIGKSVFGEKDPDTAILAFNYGKNLEQTRDYEGAARLYSESLAIDEALLGKDSPKLVRTLIPLGYSRDKAIRSKEAEVHYDRALELTEKHYGPDSMEYAKLVLEVAESLVQMKGIRTKKYLQASYDILKKEKGDKDPLTGLAAFQLGKFYMAAGSYKKAPDFLLEALNTFDNPDRPDNRAEMIAHGFLVEAFERQGQREEATQHCLAIGRMTPVADNQEHFPVYRVSPEYPPAAAKAKKEGWAQIEFTISSMGFVESPVILQSSDEIFNKPALDVIEKWRYAPQFVDGKPVKTEKVKQVIRYVLEKDGT